MKHKEMTMEVPVYIKTTAIKYIGTVDVEKKEEFEIAADKLWGSEEYDAPTLCHQCAEAELGDWDIDFDDLDYYFKSENKSTE